MSKVVGNRVQLWFLKQTLRLTTNVLKFGYGGKEIANYNEMRDTTNKAIYRAVDRYYKEDKHTDAYVMGMLFLRICNEDTEYYRKQRRFMVLLNEELRKENTTESFRMDDSQ